MQTLEEENKFVVASSTEQHFSKFMRALWVDFLQIYPTNKTEYAKVVLGTNGKNVHGLVGRGMSVVFHVLRLNTLPFWWRFFHWLLVSKISRAFREFWNLLFLNYAFWYFTFTFLGW
jgi:hypothetical protein